MTPIDQTIVSNINGNCQQAVIASVLDLPLEEVPHFIEYEEKWGIVLMDFMAKQGYPYIGWNNPERYPFRGNTFADIMKFDGGWNGYFPASVPSQTFEGCTHAVVVDMDLNIVHDPNPNKKALNCKPSDVIDIITKGGWVMDLDGKLIRENPIVNEQI